MIFYSITALFPLLGFAAASFERSNEEFMTTISEGRVPEGLFLEPPLDDLNLRRLGREPRDVSQRCGKNTPCKEGLECVGTALGKFCQPMCVQNTIYNWILKNGLENYPEQMMTMSGYLGKQTLNETVAQQGWSAVASNTQYLIKEDFKNAMATNMAANPPDMKSLLIEVLEECPEAASKSGVTILLGGHYELAFAVPKFMNSYYFAIGTGDLNFNVQNTTSSVNFDYNVTGGIFTDVCGGGGLDIGFDLGLAFGVFFSGTSADLTGSSFMFDLDLAPGVNFGAAVGVQSASCVNKLMFTLGWGLGGGIGFSGCGTVRLSEVVF